MKYAVKLHCYEVHNPWKPFVVYFIGKGNLVSLGTLNVEGWKQRRYAESFIARDIEKHNFIKIFENVSANKEMVNFYEIIEIED